ncbi:galactose-binding domain-like protein [Lipomyces japonicus]|uniref:galactose-binding domain-like protein n=1 Tax=Lipomyces japonicus TaxID=56871 RepID=UPI0034CD1F81
MSEHSHSHSHSHGHEAHNHSHSPPPEDTFGSQSLYAHILHDQIWTLNESVPNSGRDVVKPWDDRFDTTKILESDADEQLIMYIPFTGVVKLFSISIRSSLDSDDAPQTIKLFKNRTDVDFSIASELKPDATITHSSSSGDIIEYPLKRAIFSSMKSLTIFVEDNYGDDVTRIEYIGLKGECKPLAKEPVITLYEAAANPKDHKNLVGQERFVPEFN